MKIKPPIPRNERDSQNSPDVKANEPPAKRNALEIPHMTAWGTLGIDCRSSVPLENNTSALNMPG